ncbi:MAG TPA: hypothetical protein VLN74_06490 [Ilumatobacteraceae bacterium]|nr:hypothetical protein [Ilumatobacteraceae bacterium]
MTDHHADTVADLVPSTEDVHQNDHDARAGSDTPVERPKRRIDRGLLIASLVIAVGLVLVVFAMTTALTGNDGIDRPEAIESIQPVENAVQVLQQERVVVDLLAGYEARLIIDGIELPTTVIGQSDVDPFEQPAPGQQVELPTTAVFDPGNAVISFQPVEGALIESFTEGIHEVRIIYWRIEDGPEQALSYRWEFNVI